MKKNPEAQRPLQARSTLNLQYFISRLVHGIMFLNCRLVAFATRNSSLCVKRIWDCFLCVRKIIASCELNIVARVLLQATRSDVVVI